MGILDGIVEWIAEQVMYGLDLINTSVLGALGCDMSTFLRYFPAAETMYNIFVALAIGMILLNLIWQLFKNYGLVAGVEAEDPVKLTIRSVLFILLAYFADEIVDVLFFFQFGQFLRRTDQFVYSGCHCFLVFTYFVFVKKILWDENDIWRIFVIAIFISGRQKISGWSSLI